MKNKFLIAVMSAVLLFGVPCVSIIALSTGCTAVAPGSDAIVVRAQQLQEVALAMTDSFLRFEFTNREALRAINPDIAKAANAIRTSAPPAFESLNNTLSAYKKNRTPENKANLLTALAVVETIQTEAMKWLATSKEAR